MLLNPLLFPPLLNNIYLRLYPRGEHTKTIRVGEREALLHYKPRPGPATERPLVLSFHALASTAAIQEDISGFSSLSDVHDFVVIYPEGAAPATRFGPHGHSWNAGGCCPSGSRDSTPDVQFVRDLIDYMLSSSSPVPIDSTRIFASGLSNGAFMAHRVGCEVESVSAVGVVAAPLFAEAGGLWPGEAFECKKRKLPVLHIHGSDDKIVPFEGSPSSWGGIPSTRESMRRWAAINGCSAGGAAWEFASGVYCENWCGEGEGSNVTLCVVEGGGHSWPGAANGWCDVKTGWLACSEKIDASLEIINFFLATR
jgi:polyhydroxybutyrate depolymerase